YDLFVKGTLDAQGTAAAPITFTEFRDDLAGGDTNNNGTTTGPDRGNWGQVRLTGANNVLTHVDFRYGGYDSPAELTVSGGSLSYVDGNVEKSSTAGIRIE